MSTLPQPQDFSTVAYRLQQLELQVQQLHTQLALYVPVRENELQLQSIRATVERIEKDVSTTKDQIGEMKDAQDKLQIRVLLGIVTTVVTIFSGILIAYGAHLIHP